MSAEEGPTFDGAPALPVGTTRRASRLSRALRLSQRLNRPDSSTLYNCLAVVDVDLDTGAVTALDALTKSSTVPEGVHAVVWLHGRPVGELTISGNPGRILPGLTRRARTQFADAIDEHLGQHSLNESRSLDERAPCLLELGWRAEVDPMLLTVAVCTRDRPDDLERCLLAIERLDVEVGEVLVIDNAPTSDSTRILVQRHPRVRYVVEPRRGVGWARNRALTEARTPFLAYVDDDTQVHPRWAEVLLMTFAAHPAAAAVTGLVAPAELTTPAQVVFEAAGGFGRGYHQRRLKAASLGPRDGARAVHHIGAMGTGANMAFRRHRLAAIGGFDPALGPGTPAAGGEDLEALCRLLTAGDLLVYEPAAVVRHRHRRTMTELRAQRRRDGIGSASLLVGAGRKLGPAHHRQWKRTAAGWFLKNTVVTLAGSLLRPAARPMSLTLATAGGWVEAVARGTYRRALVQAEREAYTHPGEPTLSRTTDGRG